MPKPLSSVLRNEDGATSIEYGIIAALISVIIVTMVALIGTEFQSVFQQVADSL